MMNASDILHNLLDNDTEEETMILYWQNMVETAMMTLENALHGGSRLGKENNINRDYKTMHLHRSIKYFRSSEFRRLGTTKCEP